MAHRCIILLFLILVPLAVFGQAWDHGFISLDDEVNITDNPFIRSPVSNALLFWKAPYEGLYIPVTYNAWAVLARLSEIFASGGAGGRLDPRVFHAANVLIHVLCALLVFVILRMIVRADWAACGGALFFALHPVQVEPVAWAMGLKDLLCGFFSLVAVWQYLAYAMSASSQVGGTSGKGAGILSGSYRRKYFHYGLALFAFLAAVLSKPAAVVVPVIAWLLDVGYLRRGLRESSVALIGWIVIALLVVVVTKWVQPEADIGFTPPLWARPLVAADAVMFYLYKLVFPFWLGLDYGRSPEVMMQRWWFYIEWIIPGGLAVLIWLWRKRRPLLLISLALFVVGILPVSGLIPFGFQKISTVADRYLYLSILGPALAVAWLLSEWRGRLVTVMCVLVLGLLGIRSALQIRYWRDSPTLFQHALKVNPESSMAYFNLGLALQRKGMYEDAIAHYSQALRFRPDYAMAHNNIGVILLDRGNLEAAEKRFRLALAVDPGNAYAHYNLALLLLRRGEAEQAVPHLRQAARADPRNADARFRLGSLLLQRGELEEAIVQYRQALQIQPRFVDAQISLGFALAQRGQVEEGLAEVLEALRIDPGYARAYFNLGHVYVRMKRYPEAEAAFRKAAALSPDSPAPYVSLSRLLIELGRFEEAVAAADAAIKRDPKLSWAYFNRAWALESLGRFKEAEAGYRQALRLDSTQEQVKRKLLNLEARMGKVKG